MEKSVYFSVPTASATFGRYKDLVTIAGSRDSDVEMQLGTTQIVQNVSSEKVPHMLQGWYTYTMNEPKATPKDAVVAFINESVAEDIIIKGFYCFFAIDKGDIVPQGIRESIKYTEESETQMTFEEYGYIVTVAGQDYLRSDAHWNGYTKDDAEKCMNNSELKIMLDAGYQLVLLDEMTKIMNDDATRNQNVFIYIEMPQGTFTTKLAQANILLPIIATCPPSSSGVSRRVVFLTEVTDAQKSILGGYVTKTTPTYTNQQKTSALWYI